MECLGGANYAALSVSFHDWRFRRRWAVAGKGLLHQRQRSLGLVRRLRVRGDGGSKESCTVTEATVAGEEEFADKEDFIKAGGSELFYARMQENKPMEKQGKIADKVFFFRSRCSSPPPPSRSPSSSTSSRLPHLFQISNNPRRSESLLVTPNLPLVAPRLLLISHLVLFPGFRRLRSSIGVEVERDRRKKKSP